MIEIIKMFCGFIFSLGLVGFTIRKKNSGWILIAIVFLIGAIIFLGQFISLIGE